MIKRFILVYVLFSLCFGCGGGGGGDSDLPAQRPIHTTDGYGVDAVIAGATVEVYSWTNGTKGEKLGQANTDENGYYAIGIKAPNQPVLIELSGGYYTEEASGTRINLKSEQRLYAVTYYSGADLTVMVTPFTSLAAGLAQYLVENQGYNPENAITYATSAMTGILGVNCLETYPINITEQESYTDELTDGHMYGFFAAAISSWTAEISEQNGQTAHGTYSSIYLSQIMYNDIVSDGVLDGRGLNAQGESIYLFMGSVPLDSQVYRQMIGHHLVAAASADYNATGLGVEDIIEKAHVFSQRVNDIFGNTAPLALDSEGPSVYQTEPLGKYYTGQVEYSFLIEDLVGVKTLAVDLDGNSLNVSIPQKTSATITVNIDTTAYSDGSHTLTVAASDQLDNYSENTLTININNNGVAITEITSAAITNTNPFNITGTYQESTGATLSEITLDGQQATIDRSTNTWIYSYVLESGRNDIAVNAVDSLGNVSTVNTTVDLDQNAPEIYTGDNHDYHRFYIESSDDVGSFILHDENNGRPLYFDYYNTSLNGVGINSLELLSAEIPFFRFILSDPEDNGISTPASQMTVSMSYRLNGETVNEIQLSPVSGSDSEYIIPLVTEYLGEFYNCTETDIHSITVQTTDEAGNTASKLFTFKAYIDAPQAVISSLNSNATISIYNWTGLKGALVTSGVTDSSGNAVIPLFAESGTLMIELTGGTYREFSSGTRVSVAEDRSLQALVNFNLDDMDISITPLTHTAVGLAIYRYNNGMSAQDAVQTANETLSDIYGIDVIATSLIDITDPVNATVVCADPYKYSFILAGMSQWTNDAAEQNGAYNQTHFNSVMLAGLMAEDIANNGILDNADPFGAVVINSETYTTGFGDAILAVIASGINSTQLGAYDFLGVGITSSGNAASQAFNKTFNQRTELIGTEIESSNYSFANSNPKRAFLQLSGLGSQNNLNHQYYDAVRVHKVRSTKTVQYRARQNNGENIPAGATQFPYDWKTITYYQNWENGQWNSVQLQGVITEDFDHTSDSLPENRAVEWEYFITERVGDMFDRGTVPGSSQPGKYNGVYYYIYYDYVFDGDEHSEWWRNRAYGYWMLEPINDAARNQIVTPQIQRKYTEVFETLTAPYDEITASYEENHSFSGVRAVATYPDSSAGTQLLGYYIIPINGSINVKKYVGLPAIGTFSGGQINYTPNTYDQALTWTIDNSYAFLICLAGQHTELINQMPHYLITASGSNQYALSK